MIAFVLSRVGIWGAGAAALAAVVAAFAGYHAGGFVTEKTCRADLIAEINEATNVDIEKALEAGRRAERDYDAGRVPDDPYRRD